MVFLPSKKSLKVVYWSTGSQLLSEFAPLTGIEDSIVARGAGGSLFASAAAGRLLGGSREAPRAGRAGKQAGGQATSLT